MIYDVFFCGKIGKIISALRSPLWALVFAVTIAASYSGADWSKNFGAMAGSTVYLLGTTTDSSGNVYHVGSFNASTLVFGGVTLTKIGTQDGFVVKIDSSGTVLWAKNFGGSSGAYADFSSIAVDASGNVYLGGVFFSANLTTPALTKTGSTTSFAMKLDSSGNTTWAVRFGGTGATEATLSGIAVDTSGNVYVCGNFTAANLTIPTLSLVGTQDGFVIKLDSSGSTLWSKDLGGSGVSTTGDNISVDSSGNVYVSGSFNSGSLTTPALTLRGDVDAYVVKMDSSGAVTWSKNYGGTGSSADNSGLAVDTSGNVFLSGNFCSGSLTTPALTIKGSCDAFALKLDSTGTTTWAKSFGGTGGSTFTSGGAIFFDTSGNVYLVGGFANGNLTTPALTRVGGMDAYAIKLNSAGTTTWARSYSGAGASASSVSGAVDGSGNVFLGGSFNTGNFTTPALTRVGLQDGLSIKVNTSGTTLWSKSFGGLAPNGDLFINGIVRDSSGNIYLSGYTTAAQAQFGSFSLNLIGDQDAIAVKLDAYGTVLWAKNFGGAGTTTYGTNIAIDSSGNVYLGGAFNFGNLTTPALTLIGGQDAFLLKLDSSGNTTWAKNFGGTGSTYSSVSSISLDSSGNAHLVGFYSFASLTTPALALSGAMDVFVIKLNSSGTITWSKKIGGGSGVESSATGVAVDSSGNVFVGGHFTSGNLTTPALTKIGSYDAFVIKMNASGTTTLAKNFGGSGASAYGGNVAVDSSGNIYLAGFFENANLTTPVVAKIGSQDAYVFKLDSSGTATWAKNFGGSGAKAYANAMTIDLSGNVYVVGNFWTASMTTPALSKIGTQPTFVIKLDSAGTTILSKRYGGSGVSMNTLAITVDNTGNILLAGDFSGGNLTTPALTKLGNTDALVTDIQMYNTACTSQGKVKYDTTNNLMVFCDGSLWQSMNSSNASSCTGTTTGKMNYYANGTTSDFVWYGQSCRSAKSATTFGACTVNGKMEWDSGNSTIRACINGTWTSLKGW